MNKSTTIKYEQYADNRAYGRYSYVGLVGKQSIHKLQRFIDAFFNDVDLLIVDKGIERVTIYVGWRSEHERLLLQGVTLYLCHEEDTEFERNK